MTLRSYIGQFRNDLRHHEWHTSGLGPRRRPLWWLGLSLAYSTVRWAFVHDLDPNEDFNCQHCSKPVLRRHMYCSNACRFMDDIKHRQRVQTDAFLQRFREGLR